MNGLMGLSPEELGTKQFLIAHKGYDQDEVRSFLQRVALQFADFQSKLSQAEERIETLAAGTSGAAERASELEAALGGHEAQRVELAQQVEAATARAESAEARLRTIEVELAAAQGAADASTAKLAELEERLASGVEVSSSQLRALEDRATTAEARAEEASNKTRSLEQQIAELVREANELRSKDEARNEEIRALMSARAAAEAELAGVRRQDNDAAHALRELTDQAELAHAVREEALARVAGLEEALADAQHRLAAHALPAAPSSDPLDRAGAEIARVVRDASEVAANIREDADAEAARILETARRDAEAKVTAANDEANRSTQGLRERIVALCTEAEERVGDSSSKAQQLRASAEAEAEAIANRARADASRIIEEARAHASLWEAAADEIREQVLTQTGDASVTPASTYAALTGSPLGSAAEAPMSPPFTNSEVPLTGMPLLARSVARRLATDQSQARHSSGVLTAAAREGLRLAGMCVTGPEGEDDDSRQSSEALLREADHLMRLAAELGHPDLGLTEQYLQAQRILKREQ